LIFFFDFGRSDLGSADVNPLYACAGSNRPVALPRDAQFLDVARPSLWFSFVGKCGTTRCRVVRRRFGRWAGYTEDTLFRGDRTR